MCEAGHPPPRHPPFPHPSVLGAHNAGVVCGVRQYCVVAVIQEAVPPAAVADEEERGQEHQGTDGAGFPLQQEAEQIEPHEHGVVEPKGGVQGLGDQEDWEQPLQAVHGVWVEGTVLRQEVAGLGGGGAGSGEGGPNPPVGRV